MASISFDQSTINMLMSLIDDNINEFQEGDYVKMCNALKFIHHHVHQQVPIYTNSMAVSNIRNSIIDLEYRLSLKGRVINSDRLQVLWDLFFTHDISSGEIEYNTNETNIVSQMEHKLINIVFIKHLKDMYKESKDIRMATVKENLLNKIMQLENNREMLVTHPPYHEYRSMNLTTSFYS